MPVLAISVFYWIACGFQVFVGELMEIALDVMEQKGEKPPVKPEHIREAVRKLRARKTFPYNKPRSNPF